MNRFIGLSFLAVALLLISRHPATAQESNGNKVYKQGLKSSVWVYNIGTNLSGSSSGSGSLIDYKQKLVVTNYHVVGQSPNVQVMFPMFDADGKLITDKSEYVKKMKLNAGFIGKVLHAEKKRDLAIVQLDLSKPIPKGVVAIELATDEPTPGDPMHSIGSPGDSGGLFSYTPGSCKNVVKQKMLVGGSDGVFEIDVRVVESTSPVNHGDSGGPLLNDKGQQIGVTQSSSSHAINTISWFVAASEVRGLLKDLKIELSTYRGPGTNTGKDEEETTPTETKIDPKAQPKKEETPDKPKASEKEEKDAKNLLGVAKTFIDNGNKDSAKKYLNKIIAEYPKTAAAKEAKDLLKEQNK